MIAMASLACLAAQVATGTAPAVAVLFTLAVAFGLCSVLAAGGFFSASGLLNAVLICKFLIFAIVLKTAMFDATDHNLMAAGATATVMALGFLGLLIGTAFQQRLPVPQRPLIGAVSTPAMYLAITITVVVLSYGGYFIGMRSDFAGEGLQTGGILGIAKTFGMFQSFAIVPALYFAWSRGGKRFMTHPLPLSILLLGMVMGLLTTGKQFATEPLAFFVAVAAFRYGVSDKRLWLLATAGVLYYSIIVYPYSQYVRGNGGRTGSLASRVEVITDTLWRTVTDPAFKETAHSDFERGGTTYLGSERLEPFSRFAMVGLADRLIAATKEQQMFTGWETITWGFKMLVPSFISHDKPIFGANNYLAHIVGDLAPEDATTQVSYGAMANFFNAFSYSGVLIGSAALFAALYYSFRLWFGNLRWSATPSGTTLWFLLIVSLYHHSLAEECVSGVMASFVTPIPVVIVYFVSRGLASLLPNYVVGVNCSSRRIRKFRSNGQNGSGRRFNLVSKSLSEHAR